MSTRELQDNNPSEQPRPGSVAHLVTQGLGYCCEAFFWKRYVGVSSDLVAARLGIAARTVNRHRQWYEEGSLSCPNKKDCLAKLLESKI